ncbi:hypothetical protein ACFXKX_36080 [Streptomyces scopuliridis]|uniref:hypothetical protein n=1 Tax=Streptomyces scopuliridis TaxID=452529 RepID=UPI0036CA71FC
MPGKVADFLRAADLEPAERVALDQGVIVRRGQGYTLPLTAILAVRRGLLARCQPLDGGQAVPAVPAQRKAAASTKTTSAPSRRPDQRSRAASATSASTPSASYLQSGELGVGFALTLAKHLLGRRFPEHSVTIVPADTALRAGWALTSRDEGQRVKYRYRPQYFAEVWRPGEPSLVIPIASKGNYGNAATSAGQLASASVHAEAVHVGEWNETPSLLFSTEIPTDGTVTVHALQTPGRGGSLVKPSGETEANLDAKPVQENVMPGIEPPPEGNVTLEPVPGCHVTPKYYTWFQEILGHTAAAGLMAFTGSGKATARHLTDRQGHKRFDGFEHAASGSVQDISHELLGDTYAGTDHVFRLNGPRIEAFSGVDARLFRLLSEGQVEEYRAVVHAKRHTRPQLTWDKKWGGPVSVHSDGSVLAIRLLPGQPRPRH